MDINKIFLKLISNLTFWSCIQKFFARAFPEIGTPKVRKAWAGMIDTMPAVVPVIDHAAHSGALAAEAGFQRCGISDIALEEDERHLRDWLDKGLHGSMRWMADHGDKRSRPADLVPGTLRVISVGLDYGRDPDEAWATLEDGERVYVARYALGRDYHKLMRNRLQRLAERIAGTVGPFGHRVFVDSAPVLERALARNGIGDRERVRPVDRLGMERIGRDARPDPRQTLPPHRLAHGLAAHGVEIVGKEKEDRQPQPARQLRAARKTVQHPLARQRELLRQIEQRMSLRREPRPAAARAAHRALHQRHPAQAGQRVHRLPGRLVADARVARGLGNRPGLAHAAQHLQPLVSGGVAEGP